MFFKKKKKKKKKQPKQNKWVRKSLFPNMDFDIWTKRSGNLRGESLIQYVICNGCVWIYQQNLKIFNILIFLFFDPQLKIFEI